MNIPYQANRLLKLFFAFASIFIFHMPVQASTCNYSASWSLNTASTSDRIFTFSGDKQTLTVTAKPSGTAYQISVNLVINFTAVSAFRSGESCFFSLIQNGQSYSALSNTQTAFVRTTVGPGNTCPYNFLGRPTTGYKAGAYLTSPVSGLFTDIYEISAQSPCSSPQSYVQELSVTVSPGAKGSFTLDASKFVRVSAGQAGSNLNGSVSMSQPAGQSVLGFSFLGFPTCSLNSPTVTLPTLPPSAVDSPTLNRGVDFSLTLNCSQGNAFAYTATPVWSYTPASAGSSVIVNTGTATGVGVAVTSKNASTPAAVTNGYNVDKASIPANTTTSAFTFNYSAAYAKVGTTISPGSVNARAAITLSVQ
jgi:type 1 fimbria pilin